MTPLRSLYSTISTFIVYIHISYVYLPSYLLTGSQKLMTNVIHLA